MEKKIPRLIFHVDVNSAFLSWTSVKRLRNGESDLRKIPAVIGGDPKKRTSVVTAKSIPAKRYGIRTGEPVSMALQKCPGLFVAPSDFAWYETCSAEFIARCREIAPVLEQFSIDECFLDMTGTGLLYPDPVETATALKDRIRESLGFTVNVGIGDSKLLAKMASDFEKPDKVHTLFWSEVPEKMWVLPVSDLLFVGRASSEILEKNGIRTIGDLAKADPAFLAGLVGERAALSYRKAANGIDETPVLDHPEASKGYSVVTTLEEDVTARAAAHQILKDLADSVSFRMRRDGWRAGGIGVRIRSGTYSVRVNRSHQKKLEIPTDLTREIYETAVSLFDDLWDGRTGLRLLGIQLFDLTREEAVQLDLFGESRKREKERRADEALDAIRLKYGMDAASLGPTGRTPGVARRFRADLERKKKEEK